MPKKGYKPTKKQKLAGAANLKAYTDKNGFLAPLKRGVYSQTIRKRYSDLRTREGQKLADTMKRIIADLGGPGNLAARESFLPVSARSSSSSFRSAIT